MAVIVGANSPISEDPAGTPLIGYDNVVTAATVSSTTEDSSGNFPITNTANPATHLMWKGGVNTGVEVVTITCSGTVTIDYVGIARHNLGSAQIPVTIYDASNSPRSVLVAETVLADDHPAIFRFTPGSYTSIQIEFDASYFADGDVPQIAVIYVGQLLVLERGIKVDVAHVPMLYGRKTNVVNGMSESGNFLGRVVLSESRVSKAEFAHFTPDFYRNSVDPFLDAAQEAPFFWAWAPGDYPLETGFAWLTADAQPQVSPDTLRVALMLTMAGIA